MGQSSEASKRGRSSGKKGKQGERDFANRVKEITGFDLKRNLEQVRSGGYDLIGIPGVGIEVKRTKRKSMKAWKAQTLEQVVGTGEVPILAYRLDYEDWVILVGSDWEEMDMPTFCSWLKTFVKDSQTQIEKKPNRVIALIGYEGVGKSTVGDMLKSMIDGAVSYQFGYGVKMACSAMTGLTFEQLDGKDYDRNQLIPGCHFSARHILKKVGTVFAEDILHSDVWGAQVIRKVNQHADQTIILTDSRRPAHIKIVQDLDATIVRITRKGHEPSNVEDHLDRINEDILIENNFENLSQLCDEVQNKLGYLWK